MAFGDLAGDLMLNFMSPAERAAKLTKGATAATAATGPVGRAQQTAPTGIAGAALPPSSIPSQPMPSTLPGAILAPNSFDASNTPVAAKKQSSLSDYMANPAQFATPPKPSGPPTLANAIGIAPTPTSPSYPTASQQTAMDLRQQGPGDTSLPPPTASIDGNYRSTGVGPGSGDIAARIGANGTPEFSNMPSDLAGASALPSINTKYQGQSGSRPATLADGLPGMGANPVTREQFAALGSAKNLGDGIGVASFGTPGDSARALAEGQKVVDQRARFNERQNLRDAMRMQSIDNSFTSVRDSSKPVTAGEMYADSMKAGQKKSLADAITTAQGFVESGRAGQAADRQDRQAARLEDAMLAATAPNATPEVIQTYARLLDPDGSKGQARALAQAQLAKTQAETAKLNSEASGAGGPKLTEGQSKDLVYFGRGNTANARLETQGDALTSAATGERSAARGIVDSVIRGLPFGADSALANSLVSDERQLAEQSGREFVSAILRKDSGAALTHPEMETYGKTYLPQPGDSKETLKQKHESRTQALQGIRDGLGTAQVLAAHVGQSGAAKPPGSVAAAPQSPAPAPAPTVSGAPVRVSSQADVDKLPSGATFVAPDGSVKRKP